MNIKKVAILAAEKAGEYIINQFNTENKIDTKEEGGYNLITKTDLHAEKIIKETINKYFPKHCLIAEESENSQCKNKYCWYIDPIDGTNNFAQQIPHFAISIALYKENQPLMGVIFDPIKEELFYSKSGSGAAYLNDKKINASNKSSLKECILGTGFPYKKDGEKSTKTLENLQKLLKNEIGGIRRIGSAALDLCYVACGRFDGYWEYGLSPWDYAAGAIIVTEAGGTITSTTGDKYSISQQDTLASNGKVHSELINYLA